MCATGGVSYGQNNKRRASKTPPPVMPREVKRYQVVGGVLREVGANVLADSLSRDTTAFLNTAALMLQQRDSLRATAQRNIQRADSLIKANPNLARTADSMRTRSAAMMRTADSLSGERDRLIALIPGVIPLPDSLMAQTDSLPELSRREQRKMERQAERADTSFVRYSPVFRDTLPISRMTALSFVAPGIGQLHNKQYWKIPVLYATVGATAYMGIQQHKCYQKAKSTYDDYMQLGLNRSNSDLDRVQRVMIQHNQRRQLWFGFAAASYLYFICDGVMNYPGAPNNVKIATTLSTIIPGAGQIYNKSYWKAPIVMGAFATMVMVIDWNNRGYQRFKLAYDLKTSGNEDAIEPSLRQTQESQLLNYRKSYRRARDLAIILTGVVYLVNLVDAHVDAHMKNYDISPNINVTLQPSMTQITTTRTGTSNAMGLSMSLKF